MPPIDSSLVRQLIRADDKVRDEAEACRVTLESIPRQTPMRDHFFGRVTSLTRSPVQVKLRLNRGDAIWTVEIANAAVSDLNPIPEGIFWVRALDGAVFGLAPSA